MKIDENSCQEMFAIGDKIAKSVPEIAPEIRNVISIVQNPNMQLTETQIKHTLHEVMRICDERRGYLSPINTERLYHFFNKLSEKCNLGYRVTRIGWTTICIGSDGSGISMKGLMDQLAV